MKTVFILHHSYGSNGIEETKLIGAYTSQESAESAIACLKTKNGFKYHPNDFHISEYTLDEDYWADGFATVTHIWTPTQDNGWMVAQAECLPGNCYQIIELYEPESLGAFKHLEIVECEEREGELYAIRLAGKEN